MSAIGEKLVVTNKQRWAWYLYDFGNSAYAAVILLAVYSLYYKNEVVGGAEGTRMWGLAVFVAMLVVAITSPFLGAIADYSASKKRFLFFYTLMACLFCAGLFFAAPGQVVVGTIFFILAEIGYRSAQVFYNALLQEVASQEEIGRISGNGWAVGTAGGIVCLVIVLFLIQTFEGTMTVRVSFIITAIFFALSAVPIFLWLPERAKPMVLPQGENYLSIAVKQLERTVRQAGRIKEFVKFMAAFLIYNDAVIMALDFAAIIGAVLYGMEQETLIIFVIVVQATNVAGAYLFGRMVDQVGGKRSLVASIALMILVVIALFFNETATGYFIIGSVAGVAMAGMQSVSRTMVAMYSPKGQSAEFYGFFAVVGRTSSLIGPVVFGFAAAEAAKWYERQGQGVDIAEASGLRLAILTIAIFLIAGLAVLTFVREPASIQTAEDESWLTEA